MSSLIKLDDPIKSIKDNKAVCALVCGYGGCSSGGRASHLLIEMLVV